jgi:uncharacterized protein with ParB-like and HNH nuclease domain
MGYKAETVSATVSHLNFNFFLPAIQREFVWSTDKVIQLFDSLMRGYPISSFLYWELKPENRDKWQVYRFVENAREGGSHNELANTDGVQQLTLVLDGQQRLTSLLLGLKGTYTIKKKYKRKKFAESWSKQKLYLNLLKDPRFEEEDGEQGVRYGFAFFENDPPNSDDAYWLKVGRVLDFDSEDTFDKFKDEQEEKLPGSSTKDQIRLFRSNLERLYRAIWKEQPIAYHTEYDQEYDRVLDIFVRANEGGVKLSKSDLLLSMVTAKWGEVNAREEIYGFVDHINDDLPRRNNFDKDFLMKTCLVLSDLAVEYKVKNFNNQNLDLIKGKWKGIQDAIEKGVRLVNSFGIDRETLISQNAVVPIIYYCYRHPKLTLGGTTPFDVENGARMRLWLTTALLRNVFSGQSDTALRTTRQVLSTADAGLPYPLELLNAEMAKRGKPSVFDADAIEEVLSLSYSEPRTFLALSLLYPDNSWALDPHVDHIFPRKLFSKKYMNERGIPVEEQEKLSVLLHSIANLELLTAKENEEKSGQEFEKWIATRHDSFVERHLIPGDRKLWKLENFEKFVETREALIRERLESLFAKHPEEIAGAVLGG